MDKNCLYGLLALTGAIVAIVFAFLDYKIKVDKKHIHLEKNDQQHRQKIIQYEERVKQLEEKNGREMKKIDELERKIERLLEKP
jgi:flagellar motility protein MotE (MotC chaperone)